MTWQLHTVHYVEERKITQTQYRTQLKQSVHNLIHNLTSQYIQYYVSIYVGFVTYSLWAYQTDWKGNRFMNVDPAFIPGHSSVVNILVVLAVMTIT